MTTYPFPGHVADVTALTGRVEATWGNAIRDRMNHVFASAALRDAAIPTPSVGMRSVITTGTDAGEYVYSGAVVGWTKPWNQPWGQIGYATATSNQGSITSAVDLTGLTLTRTYLANRLYKITGKVGLTSNNAGATTQLLLTDATPTIVEFSNGGNAGATAGVQAFLMVQYIVAPGAGSKLYKLRAAVSAGTGTMAASSSNIAHLLIEDIGPNGAPS